MQRMHIIGGTGSGKTTLAHRLGTHLGISFYDLDEVGYEGGSGAMRPLNVRLEELDEILRQNAWITEGAFILWVDKLLREADIIVWLDLPWRIRKWRVIWRHIKADLAHSNRHPGYLNLYRFYQMSRFYEKETTIYSLQPPVVVDHNNRVTVAHYLKPYAGKVIHCRTVAEVSAFERNVLSPG